MCDSLPLYFFVAALVCNQIKTFSMASVDILNYK